MVNFDASAVINSNIVNGQNPFLAANTAWTDAQAVLAAFNLWKASYLYYDDSKSHQYFVDFLMSQEGNARICLTVNDNNDLDKLDGKEDRKLSLDGALYKFITDESDPTAQGVMREAYGMLIDMGVPDGLVSPDGKIDLTKIPDDKKTDMLSLLFQLVSGTNITPEKVPLAATMFSYVMTKSNGEQDISIKGYRTLLNSSTASDLFTNDGSINKDVLENASESDLKALYKLCTGKDAENLNNGQILKTFNDQTGPIGPFTMYTGVTHRLYVHKVPDGYENTGQGKTVAFKVEISRSADGSYVGVVKVANPGTFGVEWKDPSPPIAPISGNTLEDIQQKVWDNIVTGDKSKCGMVLEDSLGLELNIDEKYKCAKELDLIRKGQDRERREMAAEKRAIRQDRLQLWMAILELIQNFGKASGIRIR